MDDFTDPGDLGFYDLKDDRCEAPELEDLIGEEPLDEEEI